MPTPLLCENRAREFLQAWSKDCKKRRDNKGTNVSFQSEHSSTLNLSNVRVYSKELFCFCRLMFVNWKKDRKNEKNFKKGVDNLGLIWYSIQALRARGWKAGEPKGRGNLENDTERLKKRQLILKWVKLGTVGLVGGNEGEIETQSNKKD